MSFRNEWENRFKAGYNHSIWPWSDVVRYVSKYVKKNVSRKTRVLELGAGIGANTRFFLENNFDYFAIEGSQTACNILTERYPHLKSKIHCLDFTVGFELGQFDLMLDRATMTHTCDEDIIKTIKSIKKNLSPNGLFIGIDWFGKEHSDFLNDEMGLKLTKSTKIFKDENSHFNNLGLVNFFDEETIKALFTKWDLDNLEKKYLIKHEENVKFVSYNFTATPNFS